jgi:hypothetical protein
MEVALPLSKLILGMVVGNRNVIGDDIITLGLTDMDDVFSKLNSLI